MVILKADAVQKRSFLLGTQAVDGAKYRDKYYFRKVAFSGRAVALSVCASDRAFGIDCFLLEEGQEFSLWQAVPMALCGVLKEVVQVDPFSGGYTD